MGKIVKLKNKKTGVRVYPVTATSAVVDANSGERLNDTLQNKVEEAPVDGNQYVRINGTWGIAQVATSTKEKCIITLASNQGESDASSLHGATVKVTDVDSQEVYHNGVWDGTEIALEFAPGVNYKVEVGAVADYATPESKILTALDFNVRNLVMTYNTELVSVTLSAQNGISVVGQKVTINGVTSTWNGTAITKKIAYGTAYEVSVNGKAGVLTPEIQTFTSSQPRRVIDMVYMDLAPGAYIEDINGNLYTASEWSGANTVNSIVLKGESVTRRIRPGKYLYGYFYKFIEDDLIKEGSTIPSFIANAVSNEDSNALEVALQDFNGKGNTDNWIDVFGSDACQSAKNYTFPDGKTQGYIPALGELMMLYNNESAVNDCLLAIGEDPVAALTFWSSTPYKQIYNMEGTSVIVHSYECYFNTPANGGGPKPGRAYQTHPHWEFGLYE